MSSGREKLCARLDAGSLPGKLGAFWGVAGVTLLLGHAVGHLSLHVSDLFRMKLDWIHWATLFACLVLMGYGKGYKGLHRNFSPRVVVRALYLVNNPTVFRVLFAPLFCMGYFHATRKRMVSAYGITVMIVLLAISVHRLAQPWRGIIDAGVVFCLGWGVVSIWLYTFQLFLEKEIHVSPETPDC
ncbi:MAG: hypothetical protein ABFR47_04140 [Verrucomicrobiota bacterium]